MFALFDCDGLLLDTERVYGEATQQILNRFGKKFEWSMKSQMMGLRGPEAAQLLVDQLKIPMTAQEYLDEREILHSKMFPSCRPLPGVEKLVGNLKKWGIPIAVASSSFRDAFELKIKNNMELFNLFDAIVLGDDPLVKKGKPAPDIFIEAAKRLGFEPSLNGIVFEDAISGVKAGIAGGFRVVWIPDPNLNAHTMLNDPQNEELRKQFDCKNLVILNSMEEFDPEAFGLKK